MPNSEPYYLTLIGGPMNGVEYIFPTLPDFLYFPVLTNNGITTVVEGEYILDSAVETIRYKRVYNNVYFYTGKEE